MSTKHTFGTWTAEQSEEEAVTGEWTIVDEEGGLIAEVPNPYTTYEMQVSYAAEPDCPLEAYARLIAAAPEMLRELRRLSDLLEHVLATPGYGHDDNSREEAEAHVAAARAVIAKAEA